MTENQRQSFRIDEAFDAELFHEGRVVPCAVVNLSAGGAHVQSALEMPPGSQCTLGIRLDPELSTTAGQRYVSFHMAVLECTPMSGGLLDYRLRNETGPGSDEYEATTKLVFAAHRRALAQESGADEASPMAYDAGPHRRKRLRLRFSKGSTRPGSRD